MSVSKVLAQTFKEPVEILLKGFKNAINVGKTLFSKIIYAVKYILYKLKNPKQLVKDFIKFLEDLFGLGKKVGDDVLNLLPNRKEWQKMINDVDIGKEKLSKIGKSARDFTRHTNYSELKAILHYESKTWTIEGRVGKLEYIGKRATKSLDDVIDITKDPLHILDEPIRKGLDGVYKFSNPPPHYIISEVKYNTKGSSTWKARLSKKVTASGGSQMQLEWKEYNLIDAVDKSILKDIMKKGYSSILTSVTNGEVITQQLDNAAKIIKNSTNYIK